MMFRCSRLTLSQVVFWVVLLAGTAVAGQKVTELGELAQLAVSPSRFELELDGRPSVHSLRLTNLGVGATEVKVSVVPWVLDERNQIQVVPPDEQSLDQWIVFNPSRFRIEGNSFQTVRFSIRPRVQPEPGEHRAMIYIEQVKGPEKGKTIQIQFKVGVAVYAYFGEIERTGKVDGVEARADQKRVVARVDIKSDGNAHVRMDGDYYIWPVTTFPGEDQILNVDFKANDGGGEAALVGTGRLPTMPVLPGTQRAVVLTADHHLKPGEYVLALIGSLSGTPFSRSTAFRVPEPEAGPPALNQVAQNSVAPVPAIASDGEGAKENTPPQEGTETSDGGGGGLRKR